MNICGKNPSSTIRAISFDKMLFPKFEAKTTYDVSSFKIQKACYKDNCVELLFDEATSITKSSTQMGVEEHPYTISQILRNKEDDLRFICLKAKVIGIEDVCVVCQYPKNKTKRNVHLVDETGHIDLVLWRERAENFEFSAGDVLSLQQIVVSNYNRVVALTATSETLITKVDESMRVQTVQRPVAKSNVMTLETCVLALREFKCEYLCIYCNKGRHIQR